MFSAFRFLVTAFVSFSVVQAFLNSQHRWRSPPQGVDIDSLRRGFFTERTVISNINGFSLPSSLSPDISTPLLSISQGISSGNSSAFLDFDGANDIVMSCDGQSKEEEGEGVGLDAVPRKYFLPKALEKASAEEIWKWWQQRGQQEGLLKNAIVSSKKDIRTDFEEFRPYLAANKAEILQTQADFCRAVAEADMDLMRAVWLDSPEAMCFKAGSGSGAVVTGYESVLAVWASSFAVVGPIPQLRTKNIQLNFQGDTAVVTCSMETAPSESGGRGRGKTRGSKKKVGATNLLMTNIFTRPHNTDRYCLTAHITSIDPMGTDTGSRASLSLRETYQDPLRPLKKRQQGGGMLGMAGGTIQQLLNGAVIRQRGQDDDDDEDDDDDDLSGDDDDDDEDEDDDDDDDDDEDKDSSKQRLKNTFRDTMNRLVEGGGGGSRVMIIGNNGGLSSLMRGGGEGAKKRRGKGDKTTITLDVDDDDDDDDSDEEGENEVKELAARTLLAVRWLHSTGRLSDHEKRGITGDIIRNVGEGEFSRAEVAYSLLIGSGLPGEPHQVSGPNSPGWSALGGGGIGGGNTVSLSRNMLLGLLDGGGSSSGGTDSTPSFDMSLVPEEDMSEFEDVCRIIATGVDTERDENNSNDESDDSDDDDDDESYTGREDILDRRDRWTD